MGKPLYGSTGATIVVFIPLAFISGVTGGFFKALAITMVAALVISLIYARFVIPLLGDAISVRIEPGAAEQRGLDPAAVADQVESLIGGAKATQVRVGEQLLDVRVRSPKDMRERASELGALTILDRR